LIAAFTQNSAVPFKVSMVKGWFFIIATALMLERLVRHYASALGNVELARAAAEKRIEYLANFDPVTDLPNRNLLKERLAEALAKAKPGRQLLAVLSVDIDQFKHIDDTLGTNMGRLLLQTVSGRLTSCLRRGDIAARLGDHQFGIALPNIKLADNAAQTAHRLIDLLSRPFSLENQDVYIKPHVGISLYPDDGQDAEVLITDADAAMRHARAVDGADCRFYSTKLYAEAVNHLELTGKLRRALDRHEFIGHFQPCVDLATGKIIGAEILARWNHPQRGLVFPTEFIPQAEKDGLIVQIGKVMLDNACFQNKAWQEAGFEPFRLSVNLSARQIEHQDLARTVAEALHTADLDPSYLDLEITESAVMNNIDRAAKTLGELKAMGIRILMDDFGTGYSSLGALTQFPIDAIKLDKSFVANLGADPHNAVIVRAIISMAHILELKVIGEGVETKAQFELLRDLNCDAIQGYYHSRPLPAADFAKLLGDWPLAA